MKKILPIVIAVIVAVGVGAFYGGMKYQAGKVPTRFGGGANFQNIPQNQRQQMMQGGRRGGNGPAGNAAIGEIIGKDDKSITVKMPNGGSKIVFFSDSTKITKVADGSSSDLAIGKTVMVEGKTNSDGSLTAETLQLARNPLPVPPTPVVK